MNRKNSNHGKPPRPKRPGGQRGSGPGRPGARPGARPGGRPSASGPGKPSDSSKGAVIGFDIIERPTTSTRSSRSTPFRVLIAVHRPRYRGRSERAAALTGWEVTALLNKQDPVGICAKPPRPPDILVMSGDFGRQKDLAIFRAVQRYRSQGLLIVGLVDDAHTAPEGFPESTPISLCDVCLEPPYKTAEIRALLEELYEELRGEPAPPPIAKGAETEGEEEGDED